MNRQVLRIGKRKPGVPSQDEMYRILKARSKQLQCSRPIAMSRRYWFSADNDLWTGPDLPNENVHYGRMEGFGPNGKPSFSYSRSAIDPTWREVSEEEAERFLLHCRKIMYGEQAK